MPRTPRRSFGPRARTATRRSSATRRPPDAQGRLPLEPDRRNGAVKVPREPQPIAPVVTSTLLWLILALLVGNGIAGDRGLIQGARTQQEVTRLADVIEHLRQENSRLARRSAQLQADPSAIETLAREELGLIRPGEQIFIVTDRSVPLP